MKVGTVISSKDGLSVITRIENGYVAETQRIQDFVAENYTVHIEGEYKTLKEIIETQIDVYLKNNEVIEESR